MRFGWEESGAWVWDDPTHDRRKTNGGDSHADDDALHVVARAEQEEVAECGCEAESRSLESESEDVGENPDCRDFTVTA